MCTLDCQLCVLHCYNNESLRFLDEVVSSESSEDIRAFARNKPNIWRRALSEIKSPGVKALLTALVADIHPDEFLQGDIKEPFEHLGRFADLTDRVMESLVS